MSDFDRAYQSYLKTCEERGHLFNEVLGKLSLLAGEVYDPEIDQDMEDELRQLSRHVFVLELIDNMTAFVMHGQHEESNFDYKEFMTKELEKSSPNYTKILGWIKTKAIERNLLQLVSFPGQRKKGLNEIRDFTENAESLIIVDPYFFSGHASQVDEVSKEFIECTWLSSNDHKLRTIHVVHGNAVTNKVKGAIANAVTNSACDFTTVETNAFHDRVWIADKKRGLVVGTSLNGIGKRASFLLPLPDNDLKDILSFLDAKNLNNEI